MAIQYSCGVNYFIIITTALPYSCCPYSFVHTANGGNGCTDRFITRNIHPTFLIAGMLSQITTDIWWFRTTEFATAAIVLFCLHKLVNRHRLNIGTGDLWLIAGITAWSGLYNAIWCVLLGTGGFVLWHSTWCIKGHKEGPLGPWLCFGHVLLLLDNLYQPLWVI